MAELINKWDVVNKLIRLENNYQFYKEQWDADVLYRRICELEIGIGKTPAVATDNNVGDKKISALEKSNRNWRRKYQRLKAAMRQRWIPVTERLPDKDGTYLIRFANKSICDAEYENKFGSFGYWLAIMWDEDADWFPYVDVTHWMPLPEPPKGE